MPVSVNVQTVHPRKLAAVRREVLPGAVGAAWGPALGKVLGKVWPFIRSHPGPVDQWPQHFSLPPPGSAGRADTVRLRCRGHAYI